MDLGAAAGVAGEQSTGDLMAALRWTRRVMTNAGAGDQSISDVMAALRRIRRQMTEAGARDLLMITSLCAAVTPRTPRVATEALADVPGDDGEDCAICLDKEAATGWKETPCRHRFHGGCLEKWLCDHTTCSLCRHEMLPPPRPAAEEEAAGGMPAMTGVVTDPHELRRRRVATMRRHPSRRTDERG